VGTETAYIPETELKCNSRGGGRVNNRVEIED